LNTKIENIQPPDKLAEGFLKFAKSIEQESLKKGVKFTDEELADFFNNSFSGKTRANFLFWVSDINKFIGTVNIILSDLDSIKNDRNVFKDDPVLRSEFLLQSFFGEFFKAREVAKLYLKFFKNSDIFSNQHKETFINLYLTTFDWVYEIRNKFIHLGVGMKSYDVEFDFEIFNEFTEVDRKKFIDLFNEANTRENTIEFQCAIYIKVITSIMEKYIKFQVKLNELITELILLFEEHNLDITVTKHDD